MTERHTVPITVIVPERHNVELLQRCSADPTVMVLASGETLARAGLLGLLRVGRASVIAPDVASRAPGCECCQVRLDLVEAIRNAVLRRTPPRRLVVVVDRPAVESDSETLAEDPASDVVTAISTIHADGEIGRLAHFAGLVVDVDACAASTRLASGLALWDANIEVALAIADSISVAGGELLTEQARSAITDALGRLNRIGEVHFRSANDLDVERLVGRDAPDILRSLSHLRHGDVDVPEALPAAASGSAAATVETVVLHRLGVLDPDALNSWLDRVIAESPRNLLRFHAVLRVATDQARVCIHGCRSAMRSDEETPLGPRRSTHGPSDRDNVVVLVGWDLDRDALAATFESIETAS